MEHLYSAFRLVHIPVSSFRAAYNFVGGKEGFTGLMASLPKSLIEVVATPGLRSPLAEKFSIIRGGPSYWLQVRLGATGEENVSVARRALILVSVCWLPLLILSLGQGLAYNQSLQIPFLRDFAVNVRFLVSLPILVLAELGIDRRLRAIVVHFVDSGLVKAADLPSFEAALKKVMRLRDRILPELTILAFAFLQSLAAPHAEVLMTGVSNWHYLTTGDGVTVSLAGTWFATISTPLFRFLLWRWLWRMFLWTFFLWRISRVNLQLVPTHPDQAAGLGFLSEGQRRLAPIVFAGGVVIAGQVANSITYQAATLSGLKFVMIAYGVMAILSLVAPLLLMSPKLIKVKRQGILDYGALANAYTQSFDDKWVHGKRPGEPLLGSSDIQSLADLSNSFAIVRDMRPVPVNKNTLIALALAAGLPLVPVIFLVTPADELVGAVLKMLS
jgi:hypothetical protein